MTVIQLKKILNNLNEDDLKELTIHLFAKSSDVKVLIGIYLNQIDESDIFEKSNEKLKKCFKKEDLVTTKNPRIKTAKTIIRDYKKLFPQSLKLLDLKIRFTHYIAERLSEIGYAKKSLETLMCKVFEDCCIQVTNRSLGQVYQLQLKEVCVTLNKNYSRQLLDYLYNKYFGEEV
jgi:hypothetical protein